MKEDGRTVNTRKHRPASIWARPRMDCPRKPCDLCKQTHRCKEDGAACRKAWRESLR